MSSTLGIGKRWAGSGRSPPPARPHRVRRRTMLVAGGGPQDAHPRGASGHPGQLDGIFHELVELHPASACHSGSRRRWPGWWAGLRAYGHSMRSATSGARRRSGGLGITSVAVIERYRRMPCGNFCVFETTAIALSRLPRAGDSRATAHWRRAMKSPTRTISIATALGLAIGSAAASAASASAPVTPRWASAPGRRISTSPWAKSGTVVLGTNKTMEIRRTTNGSLKVHQRELRPGDARPQSSTPPRTASTSAPPMAASSP